MFESALLAKLQADTTLVSYVSSFTTGVTTTKSIFAEYAPENSVLPYIVFKISPSRTDNLAVKEFNVYVDYYDYNKSRSNCQKAAERIEFVLDRCTLQHARFNYIRMFYFSGGFVEEEDPRAIHYNILFSARAGRKKWIDQL